MAFVEHNTASSNIGGVKSKRSDVVNKKRNRTLAKQQQISEAIDGVSTEILRKAQESVSAIEELKSAMEQIAAASEQNAGASEQSLKVVTQLNQSIQKTMRELNESVALASSTKVVVEEGGEKVIETANRMQLASQTVTNVQEKSADMKKASDNIGQAVGLIAKIADQTNLLALNAAIEAAKAKEQGKGFAVVAAETRELAAVSTTYADVIREVVSNIQESIEKVENNIQTVASLIINSSDLGESITKNIQGSMESIQTAIDIIISSVKKFEDLADKAQEFNKGSESIASAAEESASAVAQITNSIEMQVNALHESEEAASGLSELAEELKNSTDASKDAEEISTAAEELISVVEEIQKSMQQSVIALEQIEGAAQITSEESSVNQKFAEDSLDIQNELLDNTLEVIDFLDKTAKYLKDVESELHETHKFTDESVVEGKVTSKQMRLVDKEANKINKTLVKIVNTNAQTTMLAVSGSVEAARAGESGKGFAVVSGDIRSLAQDAGNNMDKVQDVMDSLDEEIENIDTIWETTMNNQEQELITVNMLKDEASRAITNVEKIIEAFNGLKIANEKNKCSIEEALTASTQILGAAQQSLQNTEESKHAASLINDTIAEMGDYIEDLAVSADELQQG
ncbi:MAG: methyl-accepting chemotaxis protein [Campylobacterota bacterium]|nr:methyl-accepting chemotaxis protein [Campylobacterota bacterium]